jgi:hypothetical protein
VEPIKRDNKALGFRLFLIHSITIKYKYIRNEKIIILLCVITFGCKAQNGVVRPTGILANEAMVVSAREEASKLS